MTLAPKRLRDLRPRAQAGSVRLSPRDRDKVIRIAYAENLASAGPEDFAAVASVVRNRAAEQGKSPSAIVLAPKQFSAASRKLAGKNTRFWDLQVGSPEYEQVGTIVDGVFGGTIPDPTNGATHYYSLSGMKGKKAPGWAASMIDVTQVGPHTFGKMRQGKVPPGDILAGTLQREQIAELQGVLRAMSDETLKSDGVYGPKTQAAVRDVQTAYGLPRQDGVMDTATLVAIRDWGKMIANPDISTSKLEAAIPTPSTAPAANPLRTRFPTPVQELLGQTQKLRDEMNAAPPVPRANPLGPPPRPRPNPKLAFDPNAPLPRPRPSIEEQAQEAKAPPMPEVVQRILGPREPMSPAFGPQPALGSMPLGENMATVERAYEKRDAALRNNAVTQRVPPGRLSPENASRPSVGTTIASIFAQKPRESASGGRPVSQMTPTSAYPDVQRQAQVLRERTNEMTRQGVAERVPTAPRAPSVEYLRSSGAQPARKVAASAATEPAKTKVVSEVVRRVVGTPMSPSGLDRGISQADAFAIRDAADSAGLDAFSASRGSQPRVVSEIIRKVVPVTQPASAAKKSSGGGSAAKTSTAKKSVSRIGQTGSAGRTTRHGSD